MKKIQLTQGKSAIVDDCDFEWLSKHKWCAVKGRNTFYAITSIKNTVTKKWHNMRMHRLILNAPQSMDVDHRDHDGLKNIRSNIRLCTRSQNTSNMLPRKNKTSQYKGVSRHKNKWIAQIDCNGKHIHLGSFPNELDAARRYDVKAKELFGEFAYINF